MEVQLLVDTEICMDAELAAFRGFMKTTTNEIWVRYQPRNSGQPLKKLKHGLRVKQMEKSARRSIALSRQHLALVQTGIPDLEYTIRLKRFAREVFQRHPDHIIREKIIENDVREWLREAVTVGQGFANLTSLGWIKKKS